MKLDVFYEKLAKESEYSINLLEVEVPCLDVPWHFHPETEIMYVEKSSGLRFVGDHSESFNEGDFGIIGSNLPHVWKSDPMYQKNIPGLTARVLVVHFNEDIFKGPIGLLPETQGISHLLYESQFGIKFFGSAGEILGRKMRDIIKSSGVDKLLRLVDMLDFMSKAEEKKLLASNGYSKIRKSVDFDRFDKAHRYMIENFHQNITLDKVSGIVGMTPTSFCRYFKKHTKKSFHSVLNEIRVGHACKLLLENKMNISGICHESGFNNVSNFNEQFKRIKGIPPSMYLKIRHSASLSD
jgi:AraC-like DNA-binding protein